MGWSLSEAASQVLDKWQELCFKQTGVSNVYEIDGHRYLFEVDHQNKPGGAVTGELFKYVNKKEVIKISTWRIAGNGAVTQGPHILKELDMSVTPINLRSLEVGFDLRTLGKAIKLPRYGILLVLYEDQAGKNQEVSGRFDTVSAHLKKEGFKVK